MHTRIDTNTRLSLLPALSPFLPFHSPGLSLPPPRSVVRSQTLTDAAEGCGLPFSLGSSAEEAARKADRPWMDAAARGPAVATEGRSEGEGEEAEPREKDPTKRCGPSSSSRRLKGRSRNRRRRSGGVGGRPPGRHGRAGRTRLRQWPLAVARSLKVKAPARAGSTSRLLTSHPAEAALFPLKRQSRSPPPLQAAPRGIP
ncbi:hypothetical protein E2320_020372 [Naja naja]|nr:hypothetical protein E2320_020372 [Naja naja]